MVRKCVEGQQGDSYSVAVFHCPKTLEVQAEKMLILEMLIIILSDISEHLLATFKNNFFLRYMHMANMLIFFLEGVWVVHHPSC